MLSRFAALSVSLNRKASPLQTTECIFDINTGGNGGGSFMEAMRNFALCADANVEVQPFTLSLLFRVLVIAMAARRCPDIAMERWRTQSSSPTLRFV